MHRKFLIQTIGLFLLLRSGSVLGAEESRRSCVSNVCFNGGECIVENRANGEPPIFECICPDGFVGTLCEEQLNCSLSCQNGGECKFKEQKPFCDCKAGFGGLKCEEKSNCKENGCSKNEICLFDLTQNDFKCEPNNCIDHPCKNNATCRPIPGDYLCECGKGLRGRQCEDDINECDEEEPCLNGGECLNSIGSFDCKCQSGFRGKICEQRFGYCLQKPCKNGGCEELADNFRCICDKGFYGETCDRMTPTMSCEKPRVLVESEDGISKCECPHGSDSECERNSVEECLVDGQPCQNNGICTQSENGSTFCKCEYSFVGRWCENKLPVLDEQSNKTSTCSPNPCQNNGLCSTTDGHLKCSCPEGEFTGQFCQLACSCPRSTICRENLMKEGQVECLRVESTPLVETNNDETINIPSPTSSFSFVDLSPISEFDVANITSCDDCFNAQKCVYADRRLMCLCGPNFGGPLCSERTNACSKMKCSGNQVCRMRRTSFGDTPYCACPDGTFGSNCQRKLPPATFGPNSVAVIQAPTHSDISKEHGFSLEFTFRTTVPNSHLASAESILNELDFSLELIDGYLVLVMGEHRITNLVELRLNDADWYTVVLSGSPDMDLLFELHDAETGYVLAHKSLGHHQFNVFTVRFGRRKHNSFFTGCLREIRINRMPIDVFSKDRSVDVLKGCKFEPHCKSDSCGHGSCVELWNSFQCVCRRPYLPPNCLHELQEATFGKDNATSNVVYSVQPEVSNSLASNTEFSFLVRTNRPNGQIFYIGQSGEDDTGTFISCGLQNGTLALDSRLGGKNVQQMRGRRRIDDNSPHLVEVRRKDNNFTMFLDGSKEVNLLIMRPFAHPLIVDRVVLGSDNLQSNQSTGSMFKGTLQDVRINDLNLLLSESTPDFIKPNQSIGTQLMRQNLLMGTVSDDLCATKPCLHGLCENTFNDYVCSCQKGFMGKNCELIDFCSSSPCSSETAQCVNTHGGYICKSPATFSKTSQTKFLLKQFKEADLIEESRFSFAIRTRTPEAQVFKLNTRTESLWMELKDENVVVHYANQANTSDDPLAVNLSNGQWHSIELLESEDGQLSVSFDNSTVPLLSKFSLRMFLNGNDSWLTFGRSQNATGFKGCLHNVRFANLPDLSFFSLADSGTLSLNGTRHFEIRSLQNIRSDGCHSKDLCAPVNPCKNSALCRDLFNMRKCECAPGFSGDLCEINIDECSGNKDCGANGQCVDGINSFSCACKSGYSGPLCNNELDQCISKPCKNNGKCETIDGQAVCSCKDQFLGRTCKVKRSAKCKDKPCAGNNTLSCTDTDHGPQCECAIGFEGDLCEQSISEEMCMKLPCQNGGTCLTAENGSIQCLCSSNYEGEFCEKLKNSCKKGMCGHGKCRSIFGSHLCECNEGWTGVDCNEDINECVDEFPCTNNGTCINKSPGYECQCPNYYLGNNCEIMGVCARSPCKNSAECIQRSATEYRCVCSEGYTGKNCETEIDYCLDEPCLNGATCQRIIGSYICHCMAGFNGKNCDVDIDDCAENETCQHSGQCLDRVNGFECNCLATGWQGSRCEIDVDECQQPEKCLNGTCENLPGSFECRCQHGYIGSSCNMVDPCIPDSRNKTLHNCVHGHCVNSRVVQQPSGRNVVEYDCSCYDSYTGQFCSHVEQTRKPISIGYILGPGVALLIVSILLVCMLFFFVARNRRANQGTYSPSTHEMNGTARVQMHSLQTPIKKQERLI